MVMILYLRGHHACDRVYCKGHYGYDIIFHGHYMDMISYIPGGII